MSSFFVFASFHLALYEFPHLRFNDGFVVSGDVVLRNFAFVYLVLFGKKVRGKGLLQERIAFVFFVGKDGFMAWAKKRDDME